MLVTKNVAKLYPEQLTLTKLNHIYLTANCQAHVQNPYNTRTVNSPKTRLTLNCSTKNYSCSLNLKITRYITRTYECSSSVSNLIRFAELPLLSTEGVPIDDSGVANEGTTRFGKAQMTGKRSPVGRFRKSIRAGANLITNCSG